MCIEIPLTKGYVTVVDDWRADLADRAMHAKTSTRSRAYAVWHDRIGGKRRQTFLHRVIAARIYGPIFLLGMEVDHINGDTLDNRDCNLRLATRKQNGRNRRRNRNNTSGYKGVYWHKANGKWAAQIVVNGKRRHLGYFDDPRDAYAAYCEAAYALHGEFASV